MAEPIRDQTQTPSPIPVAFRDSNDGWLVRGRHALLALRYSVAAWAGPHPALYFALYKLGRGKREMRVRRNTELVMEGFPRCANSFALRAFRNAQPHPRRIAHHLHSPSQVIFAARHGIPCLVLIRDPVAAAISLVIRHPYLELSQVLRSYVRFYRPIIPYRKSYVLVPFEEVTSDFGMVIRAVNGRFKTDFAEFDHTEENVAKCFEEMEQGYRRLSGPRDDVLEQIVTRPSAERRERAEQLRQEAESPRLRRVVSAAREVYEQQIGHAESGGSA